MKLTESIKPISYLKAHASEIVKDLSDTRKTYIITHHGEAKAVLQDVESYQDTQNSIALLKILAISTAHRNAGKTKSAHKAFEDIRKRIRVSK